MGTASLTGNVYVDGILWGGNRLDSNEITYSFWSDASLDDAYGNYSILNTRWFHYEIKAMQLALETWANVADIKFAKTAKNKANADLNFILAQNAEIGSNLGLFNPPETFGEGIGYFNWQGAGWDRAGLQQGGFGFVTLIHELGHGLGLAHPHDNGGGSRLFPGVSAPFDDLGKHDLNQGVWTTMSYNDGLDDNDYSGILEYGYQGTPMALDIAAIQHLYGANMSYKTGKNTYFLPTDNTSGTFYSSIWDAGGRDTVSAKLATADATINLRDAPLVGPNAGGYLSAVDGIYGGFTIANGVVIEKAVGGAGNDTLTGNQSDNVIIGGGGNDKLIGGGGDDRLVGGFEDDFLIGSRGDDSLKGGSGQNKLKGGGGKDTFYVGNSQGGVDTILDFDSSKDLIAVNGSQVKSMSKNGVLKAKHFTIGLGASDRNDRFIYSKKSGMLVFDADGTGSSTQVAIAQFTNQPKLSHQDFVLA